MVIFNWEKKMEKFVLPIVFGLFVVSWASLLSVILA